MDAEGNGNVSCNKLMQFFLYAFRIKTEGIGVDIQSSSNDSFRGTTVCAY